jgi:hypothetical protein
MSQAMAGIDLQGEKKCKDKQSHQIINNQRFYAIPVSASGAVFYRQIDMFFYID